MEFPSFIAVLWPRFFRELFFCLFLFRRVPLFAEGVVAAMTTYIPFPLFSLNPLGYPLPTKLSQAVGYIIPYPHCPRPLSLPLG